MTDAQKNELRALLVRGATLEPQRQDAMRAGARHAAPRLFMLLEHAERIEGVLMICTVLALLTCAFV